MEKNSKEIIEAIEVMIEALYTDGFVIKGIRLLKEAILSKVEEEEKESTIEVLGIMDTLWGNFAKASFLKGMKQTVEMYEKSTEGEKS